MKSIELNKLFKELVFIVKENKKLKEDDEDWKLIDTLEAYKEFWLSETTDYQSSLNYAGMGERAEDWEYLEILKGFKYRKLDNDGYVNWNSPESYCVGC